MGGRAPILDRVSFEVPSAAYAVLILLVSVAATLFYLRALRVREEVYG